MNAENTSSKAANIPVLGSSSHGHWVISLIAASVFISAGLTSMYTSHAFQVAINPAELVWLPIHVLSVPCCKRKKDTARRTVAHTSCFTIHSWPCKNFLYIQFEHDVRFHCCLSYCVCTCGMSLKVWRRLGHWPSHSTFQCHSRSLELTQISWLPMTSY